MAGAAIAGVLYFRDTRFQEKGPWLKWLLATIRFLAIFILSIFLLEPVLRFVQREVRKPIVVLAQDVSESVRNSFKGEARAQYVAQLNTLTEALDADFEVRTYAFGSTMREGLDTAFRDKSSNISDAIRSVADVYGGSPLAAVVLASDGIFNAGSNPIYVRSKLNAPIFTVALGDTTPKKDLVLKRVFYNKIAYLGDQFSIQVDISAVNCAGASTTLSVYKVEDSGDRVILQRPVRIDQSSYFNTQEIILDADKPGVQRYRLVLSKIKGESSAQNNTQEIFVDVLDARQKVLILGLSPHPDISALKQSLQVNKNYQIETAFINEFKGNLTAYDLVIFHQLPSRTQPLTPQLTILNKNRTPRWFVAGLQTDFNRLNQVQNLLGFQADTRSANDVQARVAPNFGLFTLDEKYRVDLPTYPPLSAPFGEFRASAQAQPLLYQRIRKIDTEYPLLVFGENDGTRIGVLAAEGIWRWRLFNYLQQENHQFIDDLTSKMVQYLSVKEDKRKFRVSVVKNIFDENEPVLFDAELYNNSFERINEPDVRMVITNERGKEFTFTMNKSGNAYALNAGVFPVGNYRFAATVAYSGEQLRAEGKFSVQPVQLEGFETTADHNLLGLLSTQSGGKRLTPDELNALPELIRQLNTAKPVIYESARTRSLINLRWIFGILVGLLSLEWFLRRYFGDY